MLHRPEDTEVKHEPENVSSSTLSKFSLSRSSFASSLLSLSSSSSSSYSSSSSSASVKRNPEYRALRLQLLKLQGTHQNLHHRHELALLEAKACNDELAKELQAAQNELKEAERDRIFIFQSEKALQARLKSLEEQQDSDLKALRQDLFEIQEKLESEQSAKFALEQELLQQQLQKHDSDIDSQTSYESTFSELLKPWQSKVNELQCLNADFEEELIRLRPTSAAPMTTEDCEVLRSKILSTYSSLSEAEAALETKRFEARRLAERIGNVHILEERLRDALLKIRRLEVEIEKEHGQNVAASPSEPSSTAPASDSTMARVLKLTEELGTLKETQIQNSMMVASLTEQLKSSEHERSSLHVECQNNRKALQDAFSSLKAKDSAISSLKNQLDSTVALLTNKK